jgi:hypothetical protein
MPGGLGHRAAMLAAALVARTREASRRRAGTSPDEIDGVAQPATARAAVEALPTEREPPPEPERPPLVAAPPPPASRSEPPMMTASVVRRSAPREWNLWELERASRKASGDDPLRDEERNYLLVYLREFANAEGTLPADFDSFVRDSFADVIPAR